MKAALSRGMIFGGYRVEELVGRGGMGVVYRATDLSLDRPVALKLVAPELAEDQRFRARFLREPRLAASLDHPNVIPIYEAGEHEGQLYLAMRFVEGSDLKTVLAREGKLTPERTLQVLAQVAGALDAAHRGALVHRDVKPANVLLAGEGHVYLTDFGITKQLGGDSTDTGQVVGTLDYLAPEQIRGDPVDGRTDVYALGCLLYECLSGAPPFRRETEAQTLWAHMQEEPPALKGHAALDQVLRKALAKDREDRYATCAELIAAAAPALGIHPPRAPLAPAALRRRGRRLLAAGLFLLAAVVALAIVALTSGDDTGAEPLGNGVAAIDPADGDVASFTESRTPPGNVAVGEGAVWALNNEERTVSRIDPETKEVSQTFDTPGVPSELAAGEGALWIGNAGGGDFSNATVSVSRLDPDSGRVTRTVRLRGDEGVYPVAGAPRIAVGAGAVWAANPDGSVSRIDPESGRLVATIEARSGAWTIAAGREGVWFLALDEPPAVRRIDPRTNRVAETIPIAASGLLGVAVGAGSVWAAAENEGLLWRIEPRTKFTRSIDVGKGASLVAFGEGAAWTGNYVDGAVSRIDPGTNAVSSKTSIGTPQALAAGAGAAWVSVAGGTTEGALTAAGCGDVASGGATPDVLIASDLPLQGPGSGDPRAQEGAIRVALERRGFRAGDYTVGYQSCDPSTPQSGSFEFRKCAANASAFARAEQVLTVIGPYSSYCGQVQIPILNRAPGGPLAMVSPIATHPGLTRGGRLSEEPGDLGKRGEPGVYYPTGVRNFARVVPREDLQAVGQAMLADELGLRRVFLLHETASPGGDPRIYTDAFSRAARRLGIGVAGSATFDPEAKSYDALAQRVARSGAKGVFMAGFTGHEVAARVVKALRASLGKSAVIMAIDPLGPVPKLLKLAGPAAHGLYMSVVDVPPAAREGSPAGRSFARDYGTLDDPVQGVLTAAQATDVVLDAIARSDGTRASVLKELRNVEVKDGLLGDFRLDRHGDITPGQIAIFRVSRRAPPDARVFEWFQGSVVDRVMTVPKSLSG
jgi:ABC-type branched-subunit amino acid transport system substrate-binding protein/DNA-binding beta-propeller fold protein YncE